MMCPPSISRVRTHCWQRAYEKRHVKTTFPTFLPSSYCIPLSQEWGGPLCFKGAIPNVLQGSNAYNWFLSPGIWWLIPWRTYLNSFLNLLSWGTRNILIYLNLFGCSYFLRNKKDQVAVLLCWRIMPAWSPWHSGTVGRSVGSHPFPQTLNWIWIPATANLLLFYSHW